MNLIITEKKENIIFLDITIKEKYEVKTIEEISPEDEVLNSQYDCVYLLFKGSFFINHELPILTKNEFDSLGRKFFYIAFKEDFCFSGFFCFRASFFFPMLFLFGKELVTSVSDFASFDQIICFFSSESFFKFKINSIDEYKYYFDNFKNFKEYDTTSAKTVHELTIFSKFKLIEFCSNQKLKNECLKYFIDNLNLFEKKFLINGLTNITTVLYSELSLDDKKKINYLINEYPLEKLNEVLKSA